LVFLHDPRPAAGHRSVIEQVHDNRWWIAPPGLTADVTTITRSNALAESQRKFAPRRSKSRPYRIVDNSIDERAGYVSEK